MEPPSEPRPNKPPHNPNLRELVAEKQRWSSPPKQDDALRGFRGWNERGYIPHRDEPGLIQFVTFRLNDTFPSALRAEWEHLWRVEDQRERREKLEAYLDRGSGACHLRRPDAAEIVQTAVRFFDGSRYEVRAWCVMPNHVHVLFKLNNVPMARIVESWKKHSALKINGLLNRRGPLWEPDYWDTYMRDADHERSTLRYIDSNPIKAGLTHDPKEWRWSSARFRDEFGVLRH